MAGYQTAAAGNLILQQGRPPTPVVDISLVRAPKIEKLPFVLRQLPADGSRSHTTVTNKMLAEMRSRREIGEPIHLIAVNLGLADATVRQYTLDIPPPVGGWRKGGPVPKAPLEQLQRLRRAGFTYKEIAENYGVTPNAISNRLKPSPSQFLKRSKPVHARVLSEVQRVTGIKPAQMRRGAAVVGGRAADEVAKARWIAAWILVRRKDYSFHMAGKRLGGYDYSSIEFMVDRADAKLKKLGLGHDLPMRAIARALWAGDWPRRRIV